LKGRLGELIPAEAEAWLHARMAAQDTRHLVQVPSIPVGWTAGKWGEWYPDVLGKDRRLTTSIAKDFWQEGWLRQHDRLLASASAMKRVPLFLNGDLHSIAEATIERSGEHDFSKNPIRTALVGPLGTCGGWPSAGRGTLGTTSAVLGAEQDLACIEENGFTIVDIAADEIAGSSGGGRRSSHRCRWRKDAIARAVPHHDDRREHEHANAARAPFFPDQHRSDWIRQPWRRPRADTEPRRPGATRPRAPRTLCGSRCARPRALSRHRARLRPCGVRDNGRCG
jgi:hypothetical protein